jgi:diguanylate cyclase (GGDEF)-like protein
MEMTRIEGPRGADGAYRRTQAKGTVASGAPADQSRGVAAITPAELPPHVRDAFAALVADADELRRSLALARRRIEELETLVETDELTPVANRRGLVRDLGRTLAEVERHGLEAALIFVDVDGLKAINDAHGHIAGDAALVRVAEELRSHLRESDTVARLGGDEFAVLLRHVDESQAHAKTKEVMAAIAARPVRLRGEDIAITVAAGYHMLVAGETPEAVLALADRAMYRRKGQR